MTWNLWWRFGDWKRREQRIARVVEETSPDLVGLQEVWATGDENQAEQLSAELELNWAWAPSPAPEHFQRRIDDPTMQVGNAVLSRWPIVSSVGRNLPSSGADEGRTALITVVDAPGGPVAFVTTQLAATVGGSALRCEQVRALIGHIVDEVPETAALVLTGDFNAEPDSDEIRLLGGHKTAPVAPGLILVDAWRYAEPDSRPWTWDRRNPAVLATGEPNARIDYIFVGYRSSTPALYVHRARLAGDAQSDGVWPSDHAAVVADLDHRPMPPAWNQSDALDLSE
jgi:endonuclease/exonuclease/phosphatase family metal-dependent hydrolase